MVGEDVGGEFVGCEDFCEVADVDSGEVVGPGGVGGFAEGVECGSSEDVFGVGCPEVGCFGVGAGVVLAEECGVDAPDGCGGEVELVVGVCEVVFGDEADGCVVVLVEEAGELGGCVFELVCPEGTGVGVVRDGPSGEDEVVEEC